MMFTLLVAAAFPAAVPALTVPALLLPAEVHVAPGRLLTIVATTEGRTVRWLLPASDADLVPFPDGKSAVFAAAKPGRYAVFAWTAAGDLPGEASRCIVIVDDTPPQPPPLPPPPRDPLIAEFRALLGAEASPDRFAHLAQLAAVYREAVAFAERADVRTAGELAARIRTAAAHLLPPTALVAVRKRIADEITRELPYHNDAPLDAAARKAAELVFARIATCLEAAP